MLELGYWEYSKEVGLLRQMSLHLFPSPLNAHLFLSNFSCLLSKATVKNRSFEMNEAVIIIITTIIHINLTMDAKD